MNEKLKIAFIHNKVRSYREPLFKKLSEKYEVEFFIFQEKIEKLKEVEKVYGLKIHKAGKFDLITKIKEKEFDVIINPDFVFFEAYIGALISKLRNIPLVQWTEVWDSLNSTHQSTQKLNDLMLRFIINSSDIFIVPGKNQANFLIKKGVTPSAIFSAPNAPNLVREGKKTTFKINKKYLIFFVGQLIPRKDVKSVLEAVSMLEKERNDFELVIAGSGDNKHIKFLKELSKQLCLQNVSFLGRIDDELLTYLFKRADIFVSPSITDPYPLTITEALSCGTPVIISNGVGQANDIIQDKVNGFIVPIKNPKAIYERLLEFFSNYEKQKVMSKMAKKTYECNATYHHMFNAFENAILAAIDRNK